MVRGFGGSYSGVGCETVLSLPAVHPARQVALGFCLNVRDFEDLPTIEDS